MLSTVTNRLFHWPRFKAQAVPIGGRLSVRSLCREDDESDVHALCLRCDDFIRMETGHRPDESSVAEYFDGAAPGLLPSDCAKQGIYDHKQRLIGLLDIAYGYPRSHDWFIGLLMLDPMARNQSVGTRVLDYIKAEANKQDVHRLFVLVYEENRRGLKFWKRQGFTEVKLNVIAAASGKRHSGIKLVCPLSGS